MPDNPRVPRIAVRTSPYGLTSPRDLAEAKRDGTAPVNLRVILPVGNGDREKYLAVPLDRADLVALIVAASGALAVLDEQRVDL